MDMEDKDRNKLLEMTPACSQSRDSIIKNRRFLSACDRLSLPLW